MSISVANLNDDFEDGFLILNEVKGFVSKLKGVDGTKLGNMVTSFSKVDGTKLANLASEMATSDLHTAGHCLND